MTSVVAHHGVYAVFLLLIAAAVIPIGSEIVMLYAGAVAGGAEAGTVHIVGVPVHSHGWAYVWFCVAGALGNVVGAGIGWVIGVRGGRPLLHRYGRYIHVSDAKLARAERRFERYDEWAVPIGLATPLLRSFVAIPAGIVRIPLWRFLGLALIGSVGFCFGLGGAGWALGTAYTHAHHALRYVEYVIVAGIVLGAAYLVFVARVGRRAADSPR